MVCIRDGCNSESSDSKYYCNKCLQIRKREWSYPIDVFIEDLFEYRQTYGTSTPLQWAELTQIELSDEEWSELNSNQKEYHMIENYRESIDNEVFNEFVLCTGLEDCWGDLHGDIFRLYGGKVYPENLNRIFAIGSVLLEFLGGEDSLSEFLWFSKEHVVVE